MKKSSTTAEACLHFCSRQEVVENLKTCVLWDKNKNTCFSRFKAKVSKLKGLIMIEDEVPELIDMPVKDSDNCNDSDEDFDGDEELITC